MHNAITNRVWRCVAVAAILMSAQSATAGTWLPAAAMIDRIQVTSTGNVVLYVTGNNGCGGTRLEYDSTLTAAKMVYAGLLAAQAQNRPMNFFVTSCTGDVGVFANIEG